MAFKSVLSTVLCVTLLTALIGCASVSAAGPAPTPVFPASGPSPQNWNWPGCGFSGSPYTVAEAFALGNVQPDGSTVDEGDDFLEISTPVYSALCVLDIKYTTKFDHHVQSIGFQMGSGKNAIQEWAFWTDITLPNGKQIRIPKQQFDKHTDTQGNRNGTIAVDLEVPSGSVIRIRRAAVNCIDDSTNNNQCLTGQSVTFVGKN